MFVLRRRSSWTNSRLPNEVDGLLAGVLSRVGIDLDSSTYRTMADDLRTIVRAHIPK